MGFVVFLLRALMWCGKMLCGFSVWISYVILELGLFGLVITGCLLFLDKVHFDVNAVLAVLVASVLATSYLIHLLSVLGFREKLHAAVLGLSRFVWWVIVLGAVGALMYVLHALGMLVAVLLLLVASVGLLLAYCALLIVQELRLRRAKEGL